MPAPRRKTVAIVTGSRAEFGLLRPVIDAVKKHPRLRLKLIAAGSHFLPPARTIREVESAYPVAARVPMQRAGRTGRLDDAGATARGLDGFARAFAKLKPDWVVVLGDRIEAFAAASAASIAGIAVCHIHGGDRAEGIADEAMRHAITKLSHLHCAASKQSAKRIIAMGEPSHAVHVTGSPAIDGLNRVRPMRDDEYRAMGAPLALVLLHPSGLPERDELRLAHAAAYAVDIMSAGDSVLALAPNADAGREVIDRFLRRRCGTPRARAAYAQVSGRMVFRTRARAAPGGDARSWRYCPHLPRPAFLSLLKRLAVEDVGVLVGNSSAGLIEAGALGVRVLNLGPRQDGRERHDLVVDVSLAEAGHTASKLDWLLSLDRSGAAPHPFGDGRAGPRIAALLAKTDPAPLLRKRNAF